MKAVVSFSGGLDSSTLLSMVKAEPKIKQIIAVGFNYGSKHNAYENKAAQDVAAYYGIPFELIDISPIMKNFKSDLLLSGGDIPEGHYEDQSMKQTVVPARNMIFLSILAGYAESIKAGELYIGIHSGDHAIYPDCRPQFFCYMSFAVLHATDGKVQIRAPFLYYNKAEIVTLGLKLQTPYHLTRTCYKNQILACGKCGSCQERLEAFKNNNRVDPINYELNINA